MTRRTTVRVEEPTLPPETAETLADKITGYTRNVPISGLTGANIHEGNDLRMAREKMRMRNPNTNFDIDLAALTRTNTARVLKYAIQRAETEARYR